MDRNDYRPNIGIILMNREGQVLIAKRIRQQSAWQFPQGGIDEGETVEQALFREMKEELGLEQQDVNILAQSKDWLFYEIPKQFQRRSSMSPCRGQRQKWFLLQFIAEDSRIRLDDGDILEFDDWQWVDYWIPLDYVIEFKRDVYKKVLEEFAVIVGK